MRRFLTILLALAACTAAAQQRPYGGTITVAVYDDPQNLNPLAAINGSAVVVTNLIYNSLGRYGPQLILVPELAEGWDISPDGLTWTVRLRKGARFTDGTALTADDVVASLKWAMDPNRGGAFASLSRSVRTVQAVDAGTVRFSLSSPTAAQGILYIGIVPARILKSADPATELAKHPLGTGPFKLGEWKPGQITLEANPFYFEGKPHLDRIILKVFSDQKKAWIALMQGQIEMVSDIDQEDYAVIEGDSRFSVTDYPDFFSSTLLFNLKDPLLSQTPIRQAISAAIDRTDLVNKALRGAGTVTTGPLLPTSWAYNPDPTLQAFDPDRARKILADLGWKDTNGDWILDKNGEPLHITTLTGEGDQTLEDTAKRLQWQLLQVGIRMDVELVKYEELLQDRIPNARFQAILLPINAAGDPDGIYASFWHSSSTGMMNIGSYRNPAVDRLIDQGKATTDIKRRAPIYQEIHRLIATDAPAAFLYFKKRYVALSSRLGGVTSIGASLFSGTAYQWYLFAEPK